MYLECDDEVIELAKEIVEQYHPSLRKARIAFLFSYEPSFRGGLLILGKAKKISNDIKALVPYDFVISLARGPYMAMSDLQKRALIDHELCHCLYDTDESKASIRPHDFEEFEEIIERYGFWRPGSRPFNRTVKDAVEQGMLLLDDEEESGYIRKMEPSMMASLN